jgi:hypothetical protein
MKRPVSIDTLKMVFGFSLLLVLAALALAVALGDVKEADSHGLMPVITTLSTLGGAFASWAFKTPSDKDDTNGN